MRRITSLFALLSVVGTLSTPVFAGQPEGIGSLGAAQPKVEKKKEQAKVYKCPMCQEEAFNKPGKCPHCGMDLEVVADKGK